MFVTTESTNDGYVRDLEGKIMEVLDSNGKYYKMEDGTGRPFEFNYPLFLAIAFGIGAFTDLFLILGASKKNICAIYFWCFAQVIVGGIFCCIAIPLVAMKAVKEVEDEKESPQGMGMQYQKF